jgi:hypothetical protein
MNRKLGLTIVLFIVLIGMSDALAAISVGVKKGDWIEYQVTFTGVPDEEHDVTWAKMEVETVEGTQIDLNMTVKFSDGTVASQTATLTIETGQLGDGFIIPANLNSSDTFFDKNVGNITISGVEERTYAGATRTVVHAATPETTYYWDKATGVLVEGISQFPEYTMNSIADKTNMWQPQLFGLDPTVFCVLAIGATVLIVAMLTFLIARRKK